VKRQKGKRNEKGEKKNEKILPINPLYQNTRNASLIETCQTPSFADKGLNGIAKESHFKRRRLTG